MTSDDENPEETKHRARFADVADEPRRMLPPIQGFEQMPLVPLEEAIQPIVKHIPNIEHYASLAKQKCSQPPANALSMDESASIRLYTMEWKPDNQCLYVVLNAALRSENRNLLKDWFLYLKLIIYALSKLPSMFRRLFRGVKLDLSQEHPKGRTTIWWAFSSCTDSMKVLENGAFFGKTGVRTLFEIDCYSGKDIRRHSAFPNENEVLLLAATQFQIVSSLNAGHDLHIIELKEIEPEFSLIDKGPIFPAHLGPKVSPPPSPNRPYQNPDLKRYIAQYPLYSSVILDGQQVTDQDMTIVVEQAIVAKQCIKLALQNNRITMRGIIILARALRETTTLEELVLSNNHLSDDALAPLAQELSVIRAISMEQWNCCGMAKMKELEKAPVKILDFSNNDVGDLGAHYLAEVLKVKRTLVVLHLNNNRISDQGVQLLAQTLCNSSSHLQKLYLHHNRAITDSSINALVPMLQRSRSLNTVWLNNCNFSNDGRQRLRAIVASKQNFFLNLETFTS